ncbi:MFS transporter [Clostridium sediminicola]|uniref:MFS transporter n=1 Tax=Clostridium sediminicola TaxID=3114879 RepID=UPI0031F1D642
MKKPLKLAILSISLLTVMSGAAVSPALGNIHEDFQGANLLFIKMILTIPAILIIPCSLITGKLVGKIKKKKLLLIGLLIYLLGGVGGGFCTNIYELLTFRALLGIGVGIIMPLSTGLIADFFEKDERAKMMGYSSAVNQLGGMIAIILSGILAVVNWRFSFGVYGIGIITLILVIFVLPEPVKKEAVSKNQSNFNKNLFKLMIAMAVVNIVFYTVPTTMSIFIQSENLGGASMSGYALSIINIVAFVVGLFFIKITKVLKNNAAVISSSFMFVGFLFLSNGDSIIALMISMIFIGLGLGILLPLIFFTTSKSATSQNSTFALACISSSMFLGQFLSPVLVDFFSKILGGKSIRFAFRFSAGICLAATIIVYFVTKRKNKSFEYQY